MTNYARHEEPTSDSPSPFIQRAVAAFPPEETLPILDVACGYGRNAKYLVRLGYRMVAADYYSEVFQDMWHKTLYRCHPLRLDASKPLPFTDVSFGAVVVVHYYADDLFNNVKRLIVPGGLLIYESIGGHGGNWRQLAKRGAVRRQILDEFKMVTYIENAVGPGKQYATVKMLARRSM